MAEKTLSLADLRALKGDGADVSMDPEQVVVRGLVEAIKGLNATPREVLVAGIDSIVEHLRVIATRRDQELLDAIDTLAYVIEAKDVSGREVDFSPLVTVLRERVAPRAYQFKIERDGRGRMSSVVATPLDL